MQHQDDILTAQIVEARAKGHHDVAAQLETDLIRARLGREFVPTPPGRLPAESYAQPRVEQRSFVKGPRA